MSTSEESRLSDLTAKQKRVALNGVELKELLRLSDKKAKGVMAGHAEIERKRGSQIP